MTQVIEVRFLNPETGEQLHQAFTSADTHEEAISLAFYEFSHGEEDLLLRTYQDPDVTQGTRAESGAVRAWRYIYRCVLKNPEKDGPDLSMLAVLFTTYPERRKKEGATDVPS